LASWYVSINTKSRKGVFLYIR
jgi:hypothetical protein